jgi:hypothetical protein
VQQAAPARRECNSSSSRLRSRRKNSSILQLLQLWKLQRAAVLRATPAPKECRGNNNSSSSSLRSFLKSSSSRRLLQP